MKRCFRGEFRTGFPHTQLPAEVATSIRVYQSDVVPQQGSEPGLGGPAAADGEEEVGGLEGALRAAQHKLKQEQVNATGLGELTSLSGQHLLASPPAFKVWAMCS